MARFLNSHVARQWAAPCPHLACPQMGGESVLNLNPKIKSAHISQMWSLGNILAKRFCSIMNRSLETGRDLGHLNTQRWAPWYYVALGVSNIGQFSFHTFAVESFSRTRTDKTRISSTLPLYDRREFGSIPPLYEIWWSVQILLHS